MEFIKLNDGNQIPQMGMGAFCVPSEECEAQLLAAFDAGYRHVDTANIYMNERAVGRAIRHCNLKREEIFLTSKIWCCDFGKKKTPNAIEKTLKRLQVDYLDLLLLHRPHCNYVEAWAALEEAQRAGLVRSIGVSNFEEKHLKKLLKTAKVVPCINQLECHPYFQRKALRAFLTECGIPLESWYPLGHNDKTLLGDPLFAKLGKRYGKTSAQVILRWHLQEGFVVIPSSKNPEHMRQNLEAFDFTLTDEEMDEIRALDRKKPIYRANGIFETIFCHMPKNFDKQV